MASFGGSGKEAIFSPKDFVNRQLSSIAISSKLNLAYTYNCDNIRFLIDILIKQICEYLKMLSA